MSSVSRPRPRAKSRQSRLSGLGCSETLSSASVQLVLYGTEKCLLLDRPGGVSRNWNERNTTDHVNDRLNHMFVAFLRRRLHQPIAALRHHPSVQLLLRMSINVLPGGTQLFGPSIHRREEPQNSRITPHLMSLVVHGDQWPQQA